MKIAFFNLGTEKERALTDAQRVGALVPDKDAVTARPATPAPDAAVDAGAASIPPANTSAAGAAVRGLLDALAPDDLRRLLAEEEARRAALRAQEEQARARALESERERAERERRAQQRAKLEPELAALADEIGAAVAQFDDQRAALLALAEQINGLVVAHGRLWGQVQATRDPGAESRSWDRPFRWHERHHGLTLRELERAAVH